MEPTETLNDEKQRQQPPLPAAAAAAAAAIPTDGSQLRFWTAEELATSFESAVLVDVRPFSDYTVGHIRGAVSVRLSSILIRRLATGKISCVDIVIDEQKEVFRQLSADPASTLVVYDENAPTTTDAAALLSDTKSPLAIVAKSLCRTCPSVAVLQVSFSAFQSVYPQFVERTIAEEIAAPLLLSPPMAPTASELADRSPCVSVRDTVPSEILPYLFVGSQSHAQCKEIVESFRFTHVLNITSTCPNRFPEKVAYKTINIRDTWNQNIASYFDEAFEFINAAKNSGGKILIHCVAGISRSPTITIAYLMKTNGWTLCEALSFVKSKRTIVSPNLDFLVELQSFERQLFPTMGPAPPITSPDTQLLLGPGYPCSGPCAQPISTVDTSCLAATMSAMECETDNAANGVALPAAAAAPATGAAAALPPPALIVPAAASAVATHSSPLAGAAAGPADLAPPMSAGFLPPPSPWALAHSGSAPSLLLPLATPLHATHPLSHGTNSVSPVIEPRLSAEAIGRRSGSVSEGCSPRLKSPFQVALTAAVARTSPKASRRDPQSPFVPSPSSHGIFVL